VAKMLECGCRDFSFSSRYARPYPKIEKKGFTFVCFGGNIEPSAGISGLCSSSPTLATTVVNLSDVMKMLHHANKQRASLSG